VSGNVELRNLERVGDRVNNIEVDLGQHLEDVVLPKNNTPVRLPTQGYDVTLLILRAEGDSKELFRLVVDLLLSLRNHLLSLPCL
jgi:hypothetical protein